MSASELSRIIKARTLPGDSVSVEADENERVALAARFELPSITHLQATISLENDGKHILANGKIEAEITQNCAISGEEFTTKIDDSIRLKFTETQAADHDVEQDEELEIELTDEDCDEIEYSGDSFDLGEAIAQSLGLAIDPYAEGPNADAFRKVAGISGDDEPSGPLAEALKGLKSS